MRSLVRTLVVTAITPLLLTACGGGGGSDPVASTPPATTPPATPAAFQTKFGASVATAFNADPTANAIDPTASDVPAVNVTAQPEDN